MPANARRQAVIDGLRREFDNLWEETLSVLTGQDCPPVDWRPERTSEPSPEVEEADAATPVANPVGVLVRHLCGADVFWVGEMAWGRPSGRIRAREFTTSQPALEELLALVGRSRRIVDGALARLTDEDLPGAAAPPESGEPATRLFCVLHALTHHAHHNGQLLLLRRLWQARG